MPRPVEAVLAAVAMATLSPLLLLLAVAVKVGSRGPVFFRQRRIGRDGRPFTLIKLRTMRVGNAGPEVTARDDDRITAIGRLLRRTKLDELPELWNVLAGEMSFVGPRPEVPRYVDLEDPRWRRVLRERPGLTHPVTLSLRDEEDFLAGADDREAFYRQRLLPYKLRGFSRYAERRTWSSDLGVLARTVWALLVPSSVPAPALEPSPPDDHSQRPRQTRREKGDSRTA